MTSGGQTTSAPVWPVIIAFVAATAVWTVNLWYGLKLPIGERGLFGDMFGAVNSVFSGLAFVGITYAIFLQRHEIMVAKDEIRHTKQILDKQQEQLSLQNYDAKKQAFENTYFQMVRLFTEITNQIDLQKDTGSSIMTTSGKDTFPVFLSRLKNIFLPPDVVIYGGGNIDTAYEVFYQKHNTELGHYFRFLYNIFSFIDGSDVDNKKFYAKILRAQLSDAEVAILFYNGISKRGERKFKPLIERYGLLKNLNERDIFASDLKDRYASTAFDNAEQ